VGPLARARPHPGAIASLIAALAVALALAGALAGCGSAHRVGSSADPASVVPASAPLYAGAVVRPQGSQRTAALAAGRALTHQANPYLRLVEALQTPGSRQLDFKHDIAPWLGPQAGAFVDSPAAAGALVAPLQSALLGVASSAGAFPFSAHGAQGAIVMDTSDASKARSFLEDQARRAGAKTATYRGVTYRVTGAGLAFGLVSHLAVIGSETGFRAVVDTAAGGPSLLHAPHYTTLLHRAPSGALAHVYSDPSVSATPAGKGAGAEAPGAAALLGLLAGTHTADVSLLPAAGAITLDTDALSGARGGARGGSGGLLSESAQGAQALAGLPADSWLAVGLGGVGPGLAADVRALRGLATLVSSLSEAGGQGSPARSAVSIDLGGLIEGIVKPLAVLGADTAQARRDFQSWMGSAGIFASGNGLLELKAGVVIASTDAARSRAAVTLLGTALRHAGGEVTSTSIGGVGSAIAVKLAGLPLSLEVAAARDAHGQPKFILGLGESSVLAALNPQGTLSSSAAYTQAAHTLGGVKPSVIVDFATLLALIEGVGLNEDPVISKLVPYLRATSTLVGGASSSGGDVQRLRLVLSLAAG
jgi:Protein of unknown function (DUF3352)